MKVAVAINKNGAVSRHMGSCRGFLIFQEVLDRPTMEVVRINPFGGLAFGPAASEFPKLENGVKQYMSGSLAFSISRVLGDCNALIYRGSASRLTQHLKKKGLQMIPTRIEDPQKALGIYWNQIKNRAA